MQIVSATDIAAALPCSELIDALEEGFAQAETACVAPPRHHHAVDRPSEPGRTLLLMPAWGEDGGVVVKLVNVVPGNSARGLPAVQGQVLVSDPATGAWVAALDGGELTARRTAAASGLAARHLARSDASALVVVGAGRMSRALIEAHAAARPIRDVAIWARRAEQAREVADWARAQGFSARAAIGPEGLEAAVRTADIVSCATLSTAPLVLGDWLAPGAHLDLVGAFRPDMRECDAAALARAEVFVDTAAGARGEAGDLIQAEAEGLFSFDEIRADLAALCSGRHPGRSGPEAVTLFKSVGASLEDFVAAKLARERLGL